MHAFILVPFYFFGAISSLLLLILLCRLGRLPVRVHTLAVTAASASLIGVALPLLAGLTDLHAYTAPRMLGLAATSLLLAALDTGLRSALPLHLDEELEEL